MTRRITITGAAGFIGRRLSEVARNRGYHVRRLLHQQDTTVGDASDRDEHDETVVADITQPSTLVGVLDDQDLVVHLAGCTIARHAIDFERVNVGGTDNLAKEIVKSQSPPKLIYVSSLAAGGPTIDSALCQKSIHDDQTGNRTDGQTGTAGGTHRGMPAEDKSPPVSNYGKSKLAAEQQLRRYRDKFPIQIVRPPSVFGRDDPYMRDVFRAAAAGWVFVPGRAIHCYSLIHVDDLVDAILFLGENQSTHVGFDNAKIYDIVHDPPMTFPQIALIVADEVGRTSVRTVRLPGPLCQFAANLNSLAAKCLPIRPLINRDKMAEAFAGSWVGSSTALCEHAGYRFETTLEQRLRETTRQYVREGLLRSRSLTNRA